MKRPTPLLVVAVAAAALAGPALSARMDPGLWSLYIVADTGGELDALPEVTQCLGPKDLENVDRILPRPLGKCTLSNVKHDDLVSTYELYCINGSAQSRGRGEIRFAGQRYDGTVLMAITDRGKPPYKVTMRVAAKRIADCTP